MYSLNNNNSVKFNKKYEFKNTKNKIITKCEYIKFFQT